MAIPASIIFVARTRAREREREGGGEVREGRKKISQYISVKNGRATVVAWLTSDPEE